MHCAPFLRPWKGAHTWDKDRMQGCLLEAGGFLGHHMEHLVNHSKVFKFCPKDIRRYQRKVLNRCVKLQFIIWLQVWRRKEGAKGNTGEPCGSPCEVQVTNDGSQDWSKDRGAGGQGVGFSKSEELRENEEKMNSGPF